jgi:hypothetical protein
MAPRSERPRPVIAVGIVDGVSACDLAEPWLTSVRGLASYTVPKVDVMVSGIFRSQANAQPALARARTAASRTATYRMNGRAVPGRNGTTAGTGLATQDVDLLLPGTLYGDRINVVDMRFAKVLRFGSTRTNVGLDVYNLLNSNTPTTYETVYDPATNGRDGCSRRRCCCRDSCGSTCRWISDRRVTHAASSRPEGRLPLTADTRDWRATRICSSL